MFTAILLASSLVRSFAEPLPLKEEPIAALLAGLALRCAGTASSRERHGDHRGPAEQQIDANQQAQRPRRRLRQARKNDASEDEIDNPAGQHPAPAAGQLGAMLEGVHQRDDALDQEECDQQERKRDRAADRPEEQHDPGRDADYARDQRPPEAGHIAHPERRDQPDHAADQEQPSDQKRERQRRDHRHNDGCDAQNEKNDAFNQKQHPVLMNGVNNRAPEVIVLLRLIRCHGPLL